VPDIKQKIQPTNSPHPILWHFLNAAFKIAYFLDALWAERLLKYLLFLYDNFLKTSLFNFA